MNYGGPLRFRNVHLHDLPMSKRGSQPASHRQMSITRMLSADREELVKSD